MQQNVGRVMPTGVEAVDLAVEHVRQPGQRMPVGDVDVREDPRGAADRQAGGDVRILVDVLIVVEIHELVADRLTEDEPHGQQQKTANGQNLPAVARPSRGDGQDIIPGADRCGPPLWPLAFGTAAPPPKTALVGRSVTVSSSAHTGIAAGKKRSGGIVPMASRLPIEVRPLPSVTAPHDPRCLVDSIQETKGPEKLPRRSVSGGSLPLLTVENRIYWGGTGACFPLAPRWLAV